MRTTTTRKVRQNEKWNIYKKVPLVRRRQRDTHSHFVTIGLRVIHLCSCQQETSSRLLLLLLGASLSPYDCPLSIVSACQWRRCSAVQQSERQGKKWKIIEHQLIFRKMKDCASSQLSQTQSDSCGSKFEFNNYNYYLSSLTIRWPNGAFARIIIVSVRHLHH